MGFLAKKLLRNVTCHHYYCYLYSYIMFSHVVSSLILIVNL